jgi:hypothetical protein
MSVKTNEVARNKWKIKAVERNKIIADQKKRLAELAKSRDIWKERYQGLQRRSLLNQRASKEISGSAACAKGHSYSLVLVLFCVRFLTYGHQSFRGCVHGLVCMNLCFRLGFGKIPSHTSIRNWACKMGFYRVYHKAEKSDESWLLLIDESISLGNEKILLVLGVPLSKVCFEKALDLSDLQVLAMEVSKTWTGEAIDAVLQKIAIKQPICYVISDSGNNLKKSCVLGNWLHIPDITHYMANILSDLYEKDATFSAFSRNCGLVRQRYILSKRSKYMPPKQRNKLRFANIFSLVLWAKDKLDVWDTLPVEVQKDLDFLQKDKGFLIEFYAIQSQSLALQKLLKVSGYCAKTHKTVIELLNQNEYASDEKYKVFKQRTIEYLDILAGKKPNELPKIHCSSDSIESAFGKLKQKINPNSSQQMTVFILTLSSIGAAYTEEEVKKGLEMVREKDMENYRKKAPEEAQKHGEK